MMDAKQIDRFIQAIERISAAVERLGAKENAPEPPHIYGPPPKTPEPLTEDEKQRLLSNIHKPTIPEPPRTCGECAVRPGSVVLFWFCKGEPRSKLSQACADFKPREVTP